jgi:hypothetical protein
MAPLVYAAHPLTCYRSAHERACLDAIASAFPGAEVLDPAECFADAADWLAGWPALVPTLSALVLFADEQGNVGAGCLREVADAIAEDLPVLLLDRGHELCELRSLRIFPPWRRTRSRTAVPAGGAVVIDPAGIPRRHETRGGHHAHL